MSKPGAAELAKAGLEAGAPEYALANAAMSNPHVVKWGSIVAIVLIIAVLWFCLHVFNGKKDGTKSCEGSY